jgi:hypothetical protein
LEINLGKIMLNVTLVNKNFSKSKYWIQNQ